jgi:hypothetical protein
VGLVDDESSPSEGSQTPQKHSAPAQEDQTGRMVCARQEGRKQLAHCQWSPLLPCQLPTLCSEKELAELVTTTQTLLPVISSRVCSTA